MDFVEKNTNSDIINSMSEKEEAALDKIRFWGKIKKRL